MKNQSAYKIKLNLGCGGDYRDGYINVDLFSDSADIHEDIITYIKNQADNSVSKILINHVLEHLSFIEEEIFFKEASRILEPGGTLDIRVPDMEWVCKTFIDATENDYQWYKQGASDHYFGGGFDTDNRWSYTIGAMYGHQNGDGEYHTNCYTEGKFRSILKLLPEFKTVDVINYWRKTQLCLKAVYTKVI